MKHKLIQFRRIAVQGTRNFLRNAWLSTAATAVMVVTLTIILGAFVINMALTDTIHDIASNVTVSIYLKDEAEQVKVDELRSALESNSNVENVTYVSKDDALEIFEERNRDDPTILSGLNVAENVLPASYVVRVYDLDHISEITDLAKQEQFSTIVDETSDSAERRKTIDNIAKTQNYITLASMVAAALFAGISILVIFNTIRMAVFTRSDEIEIMKLIGATPSYIRAPFLFEAGLYGVIAGILATVFVYSSMMTLGPRADRQLLISPTIDFFSQHWLLVFSATLFVGVLIGFFSSIISMSRYLRLKRW